MSTTRIESSHLRFEKEIQYSRVLWIYRSAGIRDKKQYYVRNGAF